MAELEPEAWRIQRPKTDSEETADYFDEQLNEVKDGINAVMNNSPGTSDASSSTSPSSH